MKISIFLLLAFVIAVHSVPISDQYTIRSSEETDHHYETATPEPTTEYEDNENVENEIRFAIRSNEETDHHYETATPEPSTEYEDNENVEQEIRFAIRSNEETDHLHETATPEPSTEDEVNKNVEKEAEEVTSEPIPFDTIRFSIRSNDETDPHHETATPEPSTEDEVNKNVEKEAEQVTSEPTPSIAIRFAIRSNEETDHHHETATPEPSTEDEVNENAEKEAEEGTFEPTPSYAATRFLASTVRTHDETVQTTLEPSLEPSPESSPEPSPENKWKACFPASSVVLVQGKGFVRMDDIQIGDYVESVPGSFSPVLLMTHEDAHAVTPMIHVTLFQGASIITSPTHYLLGLNGDLIAASDVKIGDHLASGIVKSVKLTIRRGLFNPQTASGTILVRGSRSDDPVIASTYTKAVSPVVAHAALSILRAAHKSFGITFPQLNTIINKFHRVSSHSTTHSRYTNAHLLPLFASTISYF